MVLEKIPKGICACQCNLEESVKIHGNEQSEKEADHGVVFGRGCNLLCDSIGACLKNEGDFTLFSCSIFDVTHHRTI